MAVFGGTVARGLVEVTEDPEALDRGGRWAVVATFEGEFTCARFESWSYRSPQPGEVGRWMGPGPRGWSTSMSRESFVDGVAAIRRSISNGDVYQVNLCRKLSAELPNPEAADPIALFTGVRAANPAPFAAVVRVPGLELVTASPELFLRRRGDHLESGPIKGTGAVAAELREKDWAENVMIVDLVRNDLARVCLPGTVAVPNLCEVQRHPGLVHLVSTVEGRLRPGVRWSAILRATFPPGSVSGAPKLAALSIIRALEPVPRGPYCGMVGWVDADRGEAELAVGIRTFWSTDGRVNFGTGAGITWGSDADAEWDETELKARRLVGIAGRSLGGVA